MRQIISTALVAVVVGAVAGATMGAVAQPGPEAPTQQAIVPVVRSINAHKVDGRHAVSASASRAKRRGKLVATNRQGYLPNNIIKPAWKLIGGMPAAFADGVDDGITGITITEVTGLRTFVNTHGGSTAYAECPVGSKVVGGGFTLSQPGLYVVASRRGTSNDWMVSVTNPTDYQEATWAKAYCMSTNPAGAISASKGVRPAHLKKRGK